MNLYMLLSLVGACRIAKGNSPKNNRRLSAFSSILNPEEKRQIKKATCDKHATCCPICLSSLRLPWDMPRENLYRALSENGNPNYMTLRKIAAAPGIHHATSVPCAAFREACFSFQHTRKPPTGPLFCSRPSDTLPYRFQSFLSHHHQQRSVRIHQHLQRSQNADDRPVSFRHLSARCGS